MFVHECIHKQDTVVSLADVYTILILLYRYLGNWPTGVQVPQASYTPVGSCDTTSLVAEGQHDWSHRCTQQFGTIGLNLSIDYWLHRLWPAVTFSTVDFKCPIGSI